MLEASVGMFLVGVLIWDSGLLRLTIDCLLQVGIIFMKARKRRLRRLL
jgi:hypothetical protein